MEIVDLTTLGTNTFILDEERYDLTTKEFDRFILYDKLLEETFELRFTKTKKTIYELIRQLDKNMRYVYYNSFDMGFLIRDLRTGEDHRVYLRKDCIWLCDKLNSYEDELFVLRRLCDNMVDDYLG